MEKTDLNALNKKYLTWGRRTRLILGWIEIVFSLYLFGFCFYMLVAGKPVNLTKIGPALFLTLFAGILLVRSKPDDNSTRLK